MAEEKVFDGSSWSVQMLEHPNAQGKLTKLTAYIEGTGRSYINFAHTYPGYEKLTAEQKADLKAAYKAKLLAAIEEVVNKLT